MNINNSDIKIRVIFDEKNPHVFQDETVSACSTNAKNTALSIEERTPYAIALAITLLTGTDKEKRSILNTVVYKDKNVKDYLIEISHKENSFILNTIYVRFFKLLEMLHITSPETLCEKYLNALTPYYISDKELPDDSTETEPRPKDIDEAIESIETLTNKLMGINDDY